MPPENLATWARSAIQVQSFFLETPTLHWLIEPGRRGRFLLKRQRVEVSSGPRPASQPASAWIPVDTFLSAEDAATAVAARKTGVIEWDRQPQTTPSPHLPLSEWQTCAGPAEAPPAPPLSAQFQAAWRRLHRRVVI